jgi:nucleoside-diphosphate-sugar epimerase
MNILITGTTGFLGGAVYRHLSHKHNVFPISSKYIKNFWILKEHVKNKVKPDLIINFGWGGGSNSKELNSLEQFDNIKTCIDLFNFGLECGVKRFIGIGSSWENFNFGVNNYGLCKNWVKEINWSMSQRSNIKMNWIRPFWIYGPNDKKNRFIPTIINKCLRNEKIELHPAQNLVDYLYISDFVSGIDSILNTNNARLEYNICLGQGYKIQDIVEGIKSLTNSKSEITYNKEYPKDFNMEWVGNNSDLKNLGWTPKIDIDTGLQNTIEWHKTK